LKILKKLTLIQRIIIGMFIGIILGVLTPKLTLIGIFGKLFVDALKAIAPILVFIIILSSIAKHEKGKKVHLTQVLTLYLLGTFLAAIVAVLASFIFQVSIPLTNAPVVHEHAKSISEILKPMILKIVQNPFKAIIEGHYLSILFWSTLTGLALQRTSSEMKNIVNQLSHVVQDVVLMIITCAPIGIAGLVFSAIAKSGLSALGQYAKLIALLSGSMIFTALVIYPFVIFVMTKKNPYPLTFFCLKESGIPAFFTRSSAANIPVNLDLAKKLGLNESSYSISIPLGSAINMGGAAITISIMTLAAAHTVHLDVHISTALLLCVVSTVAACGASGIAGGSLLLIPLACSLFGIQNDIAMQVVGVGFIINIIN